MTQLQDHLKQIGACREAREWAGSRTPQQTWEECVRPAWLIWWRMTVHPEDRYDLIRLIVPVIREHALPLVRECDRETCDRALHAALVCADAPTDGNRVATRAAAHATAHAAAAAYAAADAAAYAAADAAYAAAYAAADAAYAAAYAAYAAAYAADAAADAADAAAYAAYAAAYAAADAAYAAAYAAYAAIWCKAIRDKWPINPMEGK